MTFPTPNPQPPTRRRLRLTIGYYGTAYAGWATQPGKRTVQATLESALARVLDQPVTTTVAGRTDAGVHAAAQVLSFDTTSSIAAQSMSEVLGHELPEDIWVLDADEVAPSFDARRDAQRRWYRYAIWQGGVPPITWHGRCVSQGSELELPAMRRASRALLGKRDFAALAARPLPRGSTVRTVFAADWLQSGPLLQFEICADAFLQQMVRTIVGGLLLVGRGRWPAERFATSLETTDRRASGPVAPAQGLTLARIDY
jgi:tRNA pseudouridine38-40 synthase